MPKITLLRPVQSEFKISSPFGIYRELEPGVKKMHTGIDFFAPVGTSVYAMCDSRVFKRGYENIYNKSQGLGFRLWTTAEIDGQIYDIWYGHLSEIFPVEKDRVTKGQKIARTGNTGHSTGPHLHIQMRNETGEWCDADFTELEVKNAEQRTA